jgi:amidohydrolase
MMYRILMIFLAPVFLAAEEKGAREDSLEALIDREMPALIETYERLHAGPELSYHEEKTAAFVAGKLSEMGFEVTRNVGRYDRAGLTCHGVVGVMTNGEGPTVLVRTDLDALPIEENTGLPYASKVRMRDDKNEEKGVMHACGHDIHMTSFLGTAQMLSRLKNRWRGTLVMVGQPAEEVGAGAKAMLQDGLYARFPRPDFAIALHDDPFLEAGCVGCCEGYALASVDSVDITIRGVGGHGAMPDRAKDPIVLASQVVLALQTIVSRELSPLDPAVVTVGSFHGGTKHNIIPEQVDLQLTVRTYKAEVREKVLDAIARITRNLALAAGIPEALAPLVKVKKEESTPAVYNNPALTRRLVKAWKQVMGEDHVVKKDPLMAGEDFARYSLENHEIPICLFWLGAVDPGLKAASDRTGEPLPPLHSSRFAPEPAATIRTGILATSTAVMELMKTSG